MNDIVFSIRPLRATEYIRPDYPTAVDTALLNLMSAEALLRELCETKRLGIPVANYLEKASDSALNMLIFAGEVLGHYLAAGSPVAALHISVRISKAKVNCFNQVLARIEALEKPWYVRDAWEYGLRTGESRYNEMWGTERTPNAPWLWE
ncbi:hypothetical protein KAM385_46630 [Aeromonas hydrophila]|nr:hypothetical protein KAM385_46630 [Aeromonas hydrophila]